MGVEIDKKDLKILEILKENGDLTVRQIASRTLLPITTVHNRIRRMKSLGIIRRFTIELDHSKMGKTLSAYVLARVDSKYLKNMRMSQHDLARDLKKLDFVERADIVTGSIDIIALIRVKDVEELDRVVIDRLRDVQGIESTETLVILRES
jgi:Lrp/AsnC family transcriptional regulator for asnA, asnC and gidA